MLSNEELLRLNSEGLIPGPGESEEEFLSRIKMVQETFYSFKDLLHFTHWHWPRERLQLLFDFSPRWCIAHFSSQGLAPWQAGATWLDSHSVYTIQLRRKNWLLRWIDENEILAHEAAHAARAAFNEEKNEELFAYLTSNTRWRRVLGPLFQTPKEPLIILSTMLVGIALQIIEIFLDANYRSNFFFLITGIFMVYWTLRLLKKRMTFKRAAIQALPYLQDPKKSGAFLFRLTDKEITSLAKTGKLNFLPELRWKLLKLRYLK